MTSPWNDRPGPGTPPGAGGAPAGPPGVAGPTFPAAPPAPDPGYGARPGYGAQPGQGAQPGYPAQYAPYPGGPVPPDPPRPSPLSTAVKLMWVGAGLALLNMLSTFLFIGDIREGVEDGLSDGGTSVSDSTVDAAVTLGIIFGVVIGLITVALWVWMAVMNGKGRSWARVVATVLGGLGLLFGLIGLAGGTFGAQTTPVSLASGVINVILAIAILVLLWNSQNTEYYRAHSN